MKKQSILTIMIRNFFLRKEYIYTINKNKSYSTKQKSFLTQRKAPAAVCTGDSSLKNSPADDAAGDKTAFKKKCKKREN